MYCAGTDGNTCGWKSRRDEKLQIELKWPKEKAVPTLRGGWIQSRVHKKWACCPYITLQNLSHDLKTVLNEKAC